jgi:hypothetical protein
MADVPTYASFILIFFIRNVTQFQKFAVFSFLFRDLPPHSFYSRRHVQRSVVSYMYANKVIRCDPSSCEERCY